MLVQGSDAGCGCGNLEHALHRAIAAQASPGKHVGIVGRKATHRRRERADQRQAAEIGAACQPYVVTKAIVTTGSGFSQSLQMRTDQLLSRSPATGSPKPNVFSALMLGARTTYPASANADQIGKAAVVALFDVRVAWPAVHAHVIQRTTGVCAMEDDDHGKWAVAPAGTPIRPWRRTGMLRKRLSSGKRSWTMVASPRL